MALHQPDQVSEASKETTKGTAKLDKNQEAHEKALETKKMEIAKRLGRPLIETNAYEVPSSIHMHLSLCAFSQPLVYIHVYNLVNCYVISRVEHHQVF